MYGAGGQKRVPDDFVRNFIIGFPPLKEQKTVAAFLDLCRREAEHMVRRLRHHPSIMLWCGGNEAHMGNSFDRPGAPLIGAELYESVYPGVCARLDPGRYYHPNSPYLGSFPNDPTRGDTHNYTTTWYVPGVEHPVFTTENMRVSAPPLRSMKRYVGADRVWPDGYDGRTAMGRLPWPESWEHRSSANSQRKVPAVEEYYDAVDAESLIYAFGAAHGRYLRRSVEAHRRGRRSGDPDQARISQGHLVWKLNATWPHIYSNIIDYYLEPYIPFYELKRSYAPVLLSFDIEDHIWLWLANDSAVTVEGAYRVIVYDTLRSSTVAEACGTARANPGTSYELTDLDGFGQFDKMHVLYAELTDESGASIARSVDYVARERHLSFPDAHLRLETTDDGIVVATDAFARCVELTGDYDGDEFGWLFEENYFDLMPWERRTVKISGDHMHGVIRAKPHYSQHMASVAWESQSH